VWESLLDVLRSPDALRRYAQRERLKDHPEDAGVKVVTPIDELREAEKRVAAHQAEIEKWLERMEDPRLDPENLPLYDQRVTLLRAQKHSAEADVTRLKRQAAKYERVEETISSWEDYFTFAQDMTDHWLNSRHFAHTPQAPHVQRRWLEALGGKGMVGKDAITLELHLHRSGPACTSAEIGSDLVTVSVVPIAPPTQPMTAEEFSKQMIESGAHLNEPESGHMPGTWSWHNEQSVGYSDSQDRITKALPDVRSC